MKPVLSPWECQSWLVTESVEVAPGRAEMHKPIDHRIHAAIPFLNLYSLESPVRVQGVCKTAPLRNRSSLVCGCLSSGFDPVNLFTSVVVPTTCSLTTCLTTCKGRRFGTRIGGRGRRFGIKKVLGGRCFGTGKVPKITETCG